MTEQTQGTLPWGRTLMSAAAAAGTLGLLLGNFPFVLVGALLAAAALSHRALAPPALAYERALASPQVRAGEPFGVRGALRWSGGVGAATVHEALPDAFTLREGANFRAVPLEGARAADLAFAASVTRRGAHEVGPATATLPDPLAAAAARVVPLAPPADVVVQASSTPTPRLRTPTAWGTSYMPGGDRAVRGTATNDFREIRPYAPGDPLKSVNWKATARASVRDVTLMVNDYEVEGKKSVWIFLDSSSYTSGGSTVATRFDELAHGALAVARHYLDRGHRVGFTLYGHAEATLLHPDSGSAQERRIVELLTFAEAAAPPKRGEDQDEAGKRTRLVVTAETPEKQGLGAARSASEGEAESGRSPPPSTGLGAAVERSRGFLARERPVVFVFTLLGRDPTLEKGVTEARAVSSTGRRPGIVALLAPATPPDAGLPGRIVAIRERLQTAELGRRGVHVARWDEATRPLAALLSQGVIRA